MAKWLSDFDTPIDEQPAMVEAVDWLHQKLFVNEVESNRRVRDEWESFLMSVPESNEPDDDATFCEDDSDDF